MHHPDPFAFAGRDPVLDIVRRLAEADARSTEAEDRYIALKSVGAPAAEVEIASDENEDRRDELVDVAEEFANTSATTVPGLVAHIEALQENLGYGELSYRLCNQVASAARALAAGAPIAPCPELPSWAQPAATLPALLDQLRLLEAVMVDADKTTAGWIRIIRREPQPAEYEPDFPVRVCRQIIAGAEAICARRHSF